MFQREQSCRGAAGFRVFEEVWSCISSFAPKSVLCDCRYRWEWQNSSSSAMRAHEQWRETRRCCSCLARDQSGRFVVLSSDRCLGTPSVPDFHCTLHPLPPHWPPLREEVAGRCRDDYRADSIGSLCCLLVGYWMTLFPSVVLVYRIVN